MSSDKTVKPKKKVARASSSGGGTPPSEPEKKDAGPLAKGAMAAGPAVAAMPRVTKPGDAEEVEAEKVAARVTSGQPAGPIDATEPAAARAAVEPAQEEAKPPVARAAAEPAQEEAKPPVARAADATPKDTAPPATDVKPVARAAAGTEAPPAAASAPVTDAITSPGQGRPMDATTREAIERRAPVDLKGIRVHDDAAANQAASSIDARAFTHGSDIWLAHGESDKDVGLMAHEAAHVAQQRDGAPPAVARSNGGGAPKEAEKPKGTLTEWPGPNTKPGKSPPGLINTATTTVTLEQLDVPPLKKPFSETPNMKYQKRPNTQIATWNTLTKDTPVFPGPIKDADQALSEGNYYLKPKAVDDWYVIGTLEQVLERARRPQWTSTGTKMFYDVDHKREWQLGGRDKEPEDNLWLLEQHDNRSSGSLIRAEIERRIKALLAAANPELKDPPKYATVKDTWNITAKTIKPGKGPEDDPKKRYTAENIKTGESLKGLRPMTVAERQAITGKPDRISLFDRPSGGRHREATIKADGNGTLIDPPKSKSFEVTGVHYDAVTKQGYITGELFRKQEGKGNAPVLGGKLPFEPLPGVVHGGWVSAKSLHMQLANAIRVPPLSLVNIDDASFDFEEGLVAGGNLIPSVPLLDKLAIDLTIDGRGITLSREFSGGELKFPGPIKILGSSLVVAFGTSGFELKGDMPFAVEGLGTGDIHAAAKRVGGESTFELAGEFKVDTELFDQATVKVTYAKGKFSGEGILAIGPKKVRGIKSATITAAIDEDHIEAKGNVEPDIPGVQSGEVALTYDKVNGLEVSGKLALSDKIPALKSGSVAVTLKRKPTGEYSLSGDIEATAGVPGITATVKGRYEDGAFEVFGALAYQKGMLKGTVELGATNRPVGEDGKPKGEPTKNLVAYGSGEVTLKLAPWLQGTVGIQIKPKGDLIVSGKVGIPSTLDLFSEKKLAKRLFEAHLDIPIIGFSVLGQRVGIFATIGGGIDAEAAIGPGQLQQAEIGVTYNPDDEAATHVTGGAKLHIPAHASLRLFFKGGVGAGIPIVSATVGLEVGAAIGLEAALDSSLQIDWTPAKGLKLDAELAASVQPKFKFDLTAFADVTVDYFIGTKTLVDKRWTLAQFEYGSNIRFGIRFPFHYEDGKPFDVALDDVKFEYPQLEPAGLLKDLVKTVV